MYKRQDQVFQLNENGDTISRPGKKLEDFSTETDNYVEAVKDQIQINFSTKNATVDLHLEALLPYSSQNISANDALQFQLGIVQQLIREANRQRIRKMVLVHGVGKGKLRREIRQLIQENYPFIEFLDGNYKKFGGGATELIIHQFE